MSHIFVRWILVLVMLWLQARSVSMQTCRVAKIEIPITKLRRPFYSSTLRPRQNCHHFTDDIFKCIFLSENLCFSRRISLKFVLKVRINSIGSDNGLAPTRRQPMMVSTFFHRWPISSMCVIWASCQIRKSCGLRMHWECGERFAAAG